MALPCSMSSEEVLRSVVLPPWGREIIVEVNIAELVLFKKANSVFCSDLVCKSRPSRCKAQCKSLPHQSAEWVFKMKWLCSSKGLLIKLKFQISWLTRNITWSTVSFTHTNQGKRAWTENKGPFLLRVLLWGPVVPVPSSPRKHITPPGIKIFTYYIMCVYWRQRY